MPKQHATKGKIVKRVIIIVVSILIVLGFSGYLIIHSYINKMNLISKDNQETEELESEEINNEATESTEGEEVNLDDKLRENMENSSTPIMANKNVFNILLIGSDTRESGGSGRSDSMILVSINKSTKSIIATSLLRDIYLPIPGKGSNRINAAYAYGGADLLMETIEQNFKIKVDNYASVDFFSFMDIVDAVGGVTIDVTDAELRYINDYVRSLNSLTGDDTNTDTLEASGTQLLNGKQALSYSRIRYIGTDFERTARQRRVLEQIFNKVKTLNIMELNNLLNKILPQITTNLTEGKIFSLLLKVPAYARYDLKQWSIPAENSYSFKKINGMSVLGIDFEENINILQDYLE